MKNVEIERKYLVRSNDIPFDLSKYKHKTIIQSFLYLKPCIRLRKAGDNYYITIKTKPPKSVNTKIIDLARLEYEVEITKSCYNHLKKFCSGKEIVKERYYIPYKKHIIELDIFKKDFKGLIYAEVEFDSISDAKRFIAPLWFYKDVTGIEKYKNTSLSICKNIKNLVKY